MPELASKGPLPDLHSGLVLSSLGAREVPLGLMQALLHLHPHTCWELLIVITGEIAQ